MFQSRSVFFYKSCAREAIETRVKFCQELDDRLKKNIIIELLTVFPLACAYGWTGLQGLRGRRENHQQRKQKMLRHRQWLHLFFPDWIFSVHPGCSIVRSVHVDAHRDLYSFVSRRYPDIVVCGPAGNLFREKGCFSWDRSIGKRGAFRLMTIYLLSLPPARMGMPGREKGKKISDHGIKN